MLAYDKFWDRVSREATFLANREEERKKREEVEVKLGAMTAERDAAVEKLRQTARKMKAKGFSKKDIADLTGLTAAEIAAL